MKKKWETPRTVVQGFEPNEYVAACWYIACDYGEVGMNDPISHLYHNAYGDGTGCGHADNQIIREVRDGVFRLREEDGYGEDYDLRMTRNSDYSGLSWTLSNVEVGDVIYWTTTASDGRTWYHTGMVESTTNVNRS